jgi:hypothetical protein
MTNGRSGSSLTCIDFPAVFKEKDGLKMLMGIYSLYGSSAYSTGKASTLQYTEEKVRKRSIEMKFSTDL